MLSSDKPRWAEAEDAFLRNLAQVRDLPYGTSVLSPQRARRFNALRIHDPSALDAAGWARALAEHARACHARAMPLTLQLPEPLLPDALPGRYRRVGPRLVHVVTDLADFTGVSPIELELRDVRSEAEMAAFIHLTLPDRVPAGQHDDARALLEAGVHGLAGRADSFPILAYDGATLFGQVLCTRTREGFAASSLTVVPELRGRGYMKALYAALARRFDGRLYGQIIDDVATLAFRERFASTRRLATTRTFQPDDDPYAEPAR